MPIEFSTVPLATPALSTKSPSRTVKGIPVSAVVIPDASHPPSNAWTMPDEWRKKGAS